MPNKKRSILHETLAKPSKKLCTEIVIKLIHCIKVEKLCNERSCNWHHSLWFFLNEKHEKRQKCVSAHTVYFHSQLFREFNLNSKLNFFNKQNFHSKMFMKNVIIEMKRQILEWPLIS